MAKLSMNGAIKMAGRLEWMEDLKKWKLICKQSDLKTCRFCNKEILEKDVIYFYPQRQLFWCSKECVIETKHNMIDRFNEEANIVKCFLYVEK